MTRGCCESGRAVPVQREFGFYLSFQMDFDAFTKKLVNSKKKGHFILGSGTLHRGAKMENTDSSISTSVLDIVWWKVFSHFVICIIVFLNGGL